MRFMTVFLFAILSMSPAFGQAAWQSKEFNPGEGSRYTISEETAFGDKGANAFLRTSFVVHDHDIDRYMVFLIDKLLANAPAYAKTYHYQVHFVAGVSKLVNSYAGGHIIIMLPIFHVVRSEDVFAMMLAHEIAHIALRHPGILQTELKKCEEEMEALRERSADQSEILDRNRLCSDHYFAETRNHEFAADAFAVQLVMAAGYDSQSSVRWLERYNESDSGHPAGEVRAKKICVETEEYKHLHPEWRHRELNQQEFFTYRWRAIHDLEHEKKNP